jgi:hypothetical protein
MQMINSIQGQSSLSQSEPVSEAPRRNSPAPEQATEPADTVAISPAGRAMQASASGDKDHDGDQK